MADTTVRIKLPYLVQSQAQKEVTHNMSLNMLDALVQTAVESISLTAPPTGVEGNLYLVAAGATGAWAGKDKCLAQFIGGAWVFYSPFEGCRVFDKATYQALVYKTEWTNELTAATKVAFFGAPPITKPTVTGAKGSNEALASLIAQLVSLGLITDTTTT